MSIVIGGDVVHDEGAEEGGVVGQIDNVQFYTRIIDADEAKWLCRHPGMIYDDDRLQLFLPMEEGTGTTVYDKSSNNNNGTLTGAGTNTPDWTER
jgi:hypothetical protein